MKRRDFDVGIVERKKIEACMRCPICSETLQEATSITECFHTFCKKCIYQKITDENLNHCPVCNVHLGCAPIDKLRSDHAWQDLRVKLLPLTKATSKTAEAGSSGTRGKEISLSSLQINEPSLPEANASAQPSRRSRRARKNPNPQRFVPADLPVTNVEVHQENLESPETSLEILPSRKQINSTATTSRRGRPKNKIQENSESPETSVEILPRKKQINPTAETSKKGRPGKNFQANTESHEIPVETLPSKNQIDSTIETSRRHRPSRYRQEYYESPETSVEILPSKKQINSTAETSNKRRPGKGKEKYVKPNAEAKGKSVAVDVKDKGKKFEPNAEGKGKNIEPNVGVYWKKVERNARDKGKNVEPNAKGKEKYVETNSAEENYLRKSLDSLLVAARRTLYDMENSLATFAIPALPTDPGKELLLAPQVKESESLLTPQVKVSELLLTPQVKESENASKTDVNKGNATASTSRPQRSRRSQSQPNNASAADANRTILPSQVVQPRNIVGRVAPIWVVLTASADRGLRLEQISKNHLQIKDGSMPVSVLRSYLAIKLGFDREYGEQIEISLRGQPLEPHQQMKDLLEFWVQTAISPERIQGRVGGSAKDFEMVLTYCRKPKEHRFL